LIGTCRKCGCHWTKHMHITYKYESKLTYVSIDDLDSSSTPQSAMQCIDKRISDLRKEETSIRQICVKLSQFLKANSITPFNDDVLEYLRHFINEEKQKRTAGTDNTDVIHGLEKMIEDYTKELELYTQSISTKDTSMSTDQFDNHMQIEEIFTLVQQLYALPINGKLIEEQVEGMKQGHTQAVRSEEQFVDLPTGSDSPQILLDLRKIVKQTKK
jgi:hypothetical protein